jgi:hypothetical protein
MPPLTLLSVQLAASVIVLSLVMRVAAVPLRSAEPSLLGRLGLLDPGLAHAMSLGTDRLWERPSC